MKYFEYKAKDPNGKIRTDVITADTREAALSALRGRGLQIVELSEMWDFLGIRQMLHRRATAVGKADIAEFFEQMAFMLGTDIKIYNALIVLRDFSASKKLSYLADRLSSEVRQGASLYEAACKNKGIFEDYMLQQIRSGEESGDMVGALTNLANQIRREVAFKKKVSGAMVYPIFIVIILVVVVSALMILVIPNMASALTELGGELPAITVFVINCSDFVKGYWWAILAVIVVLVAVWIILNKIPNIKYNIDRISLKVPLLGSLLQKIDIARFCRCMASMLTCGVSLVKALSIAKTTIANKFMQKAMEDCETDIRIKGWGLPYAMRQHPAFPELMIQLVEIGVTSSKIPEVMTKLANQYEIESEDTLKKLTGLMEPLLMIIVGGVVGVVVISMFLPMMSVLDTIQ